MKWGARDIIHSMSMRQTCKHKMSCDVMNCIGCPKYSFKKDKKKNPHKKSFPNPYPHELNY